MHPICTTTKDAELFPEVWQVAIQEHLALIDTLNSGSSSHKYIAQFDYLDPPSFVVLNTYSLPMWHRVIIGDFPSRLYSDGEFIYYTNGRNAIFRGGDLPSSNRIYDGKLIKLSWETRCIGPVSVAIDGFWWQQNDRIARKKYMRETYPKVVRYSYIVDENAFISCK